MSNIYSYFLGNQLSAFHKCYQYKSIMFKFLLILIYFSRDVDCSSYNDATIVFFSLSVSREEEKRADNNYLVTQQAYLYNDSNLGKHRGRILFLNVMFFPLYFLRPNK